MSAGSESCSYGNRCYRKKPEHFNEFKHEHLDELLNQIGSGEILVPDNYPRNISRQTLIYQLKLVRERRGAVENGEVAVREAEEVSERKRQNSEGSENLGSGEGESSSQGSLAKRIKQEDETGGSGPTVRNLPELPTQAAARKEFEEYRARMLKQSSPKVEEKLKRAAPYNLFLTTVSASKETAEELLSLSLVQILSSEMGDLDESLQINFMVELGWLLAQYQVAGIRKRPLTLLYGMMDESPDSIDFLRAVQVSPPSPFGSHHTKMMVLLYRDGSLRVVVSTANLVESDWLNRTQGLWVSERCPRLDEDADTAAGESPTGFKRDLLRYLSFYKLPELMGWLGNLSRTDFSQIKVCFVASVPGTHATSHWGHPSLGAHLQASTLTGDSTLVLAQASSIGSLGPKPETWLKGEFLNALMKGSSQGGVSAQLQLVYPTFGNVEASYDGLLGGGCLPYSRVTHEKQPWLTPLMAQWASEARHRTRAPPHIKTYCRLAAPALNALDFFLLTSANLSRAAWGSLSRKGTVNILSYEAGVLFLPCHFGTSSTFPLSSFPFPYDLPTTPYSFSDVPWFSDCLS